MNSTGLFVIFLLIAVWFFVLRTRATPLSSKADFDAMVAGGQPVVVDFFSNA